MTFSELFPFNVLFDEIPSLSKEGIRILEFYDGKKYVIFEKKIYIVTNKLSYKDVALHRISMDFLAENLNKLEMKFNEIPNLNTCIGTQKNLIKEDLSKFIDMDYNLNDKKIKKYRKNKRKIRKYESKPKSGNKILFKKNNFPQEIHTEPNNLSTNLDHTYDYNTLNCRAYYQKMKMPLKSKNETCYLIQSNSYCNYHSKNNFYLFG